MLLSRSFKLSLLVALGLLAMLPGWTGAALADAKSHDAARRAVEAGEIQSLEAILTLIKPKLAGEVTGIEIERKNGRWIYELTVVDARGRIQEVYVNASTGEIERVKVK